MLNITVPRPFLTKNLQRFSHVVLRWLKNGKKPSFQLALFVQNQEFKYQKHMWNLFKDNKGTILTSLLSTLNKFYIFFFIFYCRLWTNNCWLCKGCSGIFNIGFALKIFQNFSSVSIVDFKQVNESLLDLFFFKHEYFMRA